MSGRTVSADEARALLDGTTPGPWEAWQNRDAEPHVSEVGRGYFGHVAAPSTGVEDYGRANAALLAAAPDLAHTVVVQAEQIAAVLALHQAREEADGSRTDPWCQECDDVLPCYTLRALGVEQ